MKGLDRREFLKLFAASAGCFAVTASAVPFVSSVAHADVAGGPFHFPQGLASGDPQPDAVMLWTRVEAIALPTGNDKPIELVLQVSESEDFAESGGASIREIPARQ